MRLILLAFASVAALAAPAAAETPREMLVAAAFASASKPSALAKVTGALKGAEATLARDPQNWEARLQRTIAIAYRGKLNRSRSDIAAARKGFEALVASNPRDAEAAAALGGWHIASIDELGAIVARTGLGARKAVGLQALDRSVALGGGRAMFPAYAALSRIQLDPNDVANARRLAEAAVKGRAATPLDRLMKARALALLTPLRANNGKAASALADKLMPFGKLR